MRYSITSPDISQTIEGPIHALLSHIPTVPVAESDVVIVPISRFHSFQFDPNLSLRLGGRPWVLVDFVEYGWDWNRKKTHLFGQGTFDEYNTFNDWGIIRKEWAAFDQWVSENPPALTLKRELLAKDVSDRVKPIDYGCFLIPERIDTKEQFSSRPLEVIFSWGLSHEVRKRVHGEIYKASSKYGYDVVSDWNLISRAIQESKRLWATISVPHYNRVDMSVVMRYNGMAKLSVSMPGAGIKCYRSAEAPVNSIMVLQQDPLAWSFPWLDGVNCIRVLKDHPDDQNSICGLEGDEEVPTMVNALKLGDDRLYQIYLNGLENVDRYRPERYCKHYIIPTIEAQFTSV